MPVDQNQLCDLLRATPLFNKLDYDDVLSLSQGAQVFNYAADAYIFNQNGVADGFYIIIDGEVIILDEQESHKKPITRLARADFLGEEAFFDETIRVFSARCTKPTTVVKLNPHYALALFAKYPHLSKTLEIAIESRLFARRLSFDWLAENEVVYVVVRRHAIFLAAKIILPLLIWLAVFILALLTRFIWLPESTFGIVLAVVSTVLGLALAGWNVYDWANDIHIVTSKRVVWIERKTLFYDSRQEAPLSTLVSVGVQKSALGALFNFADVYVRTFVGNIIFSNVPNPEIIAGMIEAYWERSKITNPREEQQSMEKILRRKLALPGSATSPEAEAAGGVQPQQKQDDSLRPRQNVPEDGGFFRWLFANFLRLRIEENGTITYRKHWFVLIKSAGLPTLLFTAGMVGMILRLVNVFLIPQSLGAALVFFVLINLALFLWMMYRYIDWANDIYMVTAEQIIDIERKPLGKENRRSAPLDNIMSIEFERLGIWGLMFNFGTVLITVGSQKFSFDYVHNPSQVQQEIFNRRAERQETARRRQMESERERISDWIIAYHQNAEQWHSLHPEDDQE